MICFKKKCVLYKPPSLSLHPPLWLRSPIAPSAKERALKKGRGRGMFPAPLYPSYSSTPPRTSHGRSCGQRVLSLNVQFMSRVPETSAALFAHRHLLPCAKLSELKSMNTFKFCSEKRLFLRVQRRVFTFASASAKPFRYIFPLIYFVSLRTVL